MKVIKRLLQYNVAFWLRRWQTARDHLLHGYRNGATQCISELNNCKQKLYHGNQIPHITSQKCMIQIPKDIQGMYPIITADSKKPKDQIAEYYYYSMIE